MLKKRYLRLLQSYSRQLGRRNAARWIETFSHADWKVVELGCGSGGLASLLPHGSYVGIDQSPSALAQARRRCRGRGEFIEADVHTVQPPEADLVVFLGLVERMSLAELSSLLGRIRAKRILFSFVSPPAGRRLHRWPLRLLFRGLSHRSAHSTDVIAELLEQHGYRRREVRRSLWYGPGKLVFAEKAKSRAMPARSALAQTAR